MDGFYRSQTSGLGGAARLFSGGSGRLGGVPQILRFLSQFLQRLTVLVADPSGLLCQLPEPFGFRSRSLRRRPMPFGGLAIEFGLLTAILRLSPLDLRVLAVLLWRILIVRHIASL